MIRRTLLSAGFFLFLAAAFATANGAADEPTQDTSDIVIRAAAPEDIEDPRLRRRMKRREIFETLPEGHSIRIVLKYRAEFGHHRRYSITRLDKQGRPHGLERFTRRSPNRTSRTVTWEHGVKDGPECHFDLQGRKKAEIPWVDGVITGTKKTFYPTGEVRTETEYVDGKAHGETRTNSPEGKVLRKGEYIEGDRHGELIDYFPRTDGQPRRIVPYVKGKVHGTVKEFYENGNPKRELPFVEDRMHGVEKEYDGEGNLENTAYWYEGDRVSKDVYRQRVAEDKGT